MCLVHLIFQIIRPGPNTCIAFPKMPPFCGEEIQTPRPIPNLEDMPLSAVCCCLFNIFTATVHIWTPLSPSQTEDMPRCGWQKIQINTDRIAFVKRIKFYVKDFIMMGAFVKRIKFYVKDFIMMKVPNWVDPFSNKTYTWMHHSLQRTLIFPFHEERTIF
jgi:hypothetical protein